jgi:hypothetical protein
VVVIDEVRAIALALPGTYEQPSYDDRPSWRTKPRMFAWFRDDPEALVVWVSSIAEKEALLASDPVVFTTTPTTTAPPSSWSTSTRSTRTR